MQVRAAIIQGGCQTRGWCVSTHIPERGPGGGPPSRSGRQLRTCDAAQGLAGPGAVGGPEANRGSGVELDVWVWDGGIGVPEVEPVGAGESAERLSSRQGGGKGRERQQGATYLSWYLRVRDCSVSPACGYRARKRSPFQARHVGHQARSRTKAARAGLDIRSAQSCPGRRSSTCCRERAEVGLT